MRLVRFEDPNALYDRAAAQIERLCAAAVRERSAFHLALSGGRTPHPVYCRLASSSALDWGRVHIYWSDERCVPPTDDRSNYRAAFEALLRQVSIPTGNVHRIVGEAVPVDAADGYEVVLHDRLGPEGRLDLILLGIGADGHTASLFPRDQALAESDRWVVPVHTSARPPWRVTMTLRLINAARNVLFLATGSEKAEAVRSVIAGKPLPAALVNPADGRVTLFADSEAASLLP